MSNNLFSFATKELSQDAFICWSINWLNYPECPQYALGKATMDLFLGNKKQEKYYNVEVKRQYKSIDVLVLFNDTYALIVEDKTNTSEHSDQIVRYEEKIKTEYPNRKIILSYVKTGIMYDADWRMKYKVDTVVDLYNWLDVVEKCEAECGSEIIIDFADYLRGKKAERDRMDQLIINGQYSAAAESAYGQVKLLSAIFFDRSKGIAAGKSKYNLSYDENSNIKFVDEIYGETNRSGSTWTQYSFWLKDHDTQYDQSENAFVEYQTVFWRVDYNKTKGKYIAMRQYDWCARAVATPHIEAAYKKRKKDCYESIKNIAKAAVEKTSIEGELKEKFCEVGYKPGLNESDIIMIPMEFLNDIGSFEEVRTFIRAITNEVKEEAEKIYKH